MKNYEKKIHISNINLSKINKLRKNKEAFSISDLLEILSIKKTLLFVALLIVFLYPHKSKEKIQINQIEEYFNTTIRNNSVLFFEELTYHYECIPGFSKYFLDLGYNIDIIMTKNGKDIFSFFKNKEKIRLYIWNNSKYYFGDKYIQKFRVSFSKYVAIIIPTMEGFMKKFYNGTNLITGNNSIFVYHFFPFMNQIDFHNRNRSWTLFNFTKKALGVNPHYFGDIKQRDKNKITRFFITSTIARNYTDFISAVDQLQRENYKFHVVVTGRFETLSYEKLPDNVKEYFTFKTHTSYIELFKIIDSVDFIIINLKYKHKMDNYYINVRATGTSQLSYGFLKPCLIQTYFAPTYKMNDNNSLIYNETMYYAMRDAIMMSNKKYKKMQFHLKKTADQIYETSLNNVKISIDNILQK